MTVDWTKPIEAVHKTTGRVVPMEYDRPELSSTGHVMWHRTRQSPEQRSNENWYESGEDYCSNREWYIRNVVEQPQRTVDWTKPIETVPNELNPVPVPCRLRDEDNHLPSSRSVEILGPWFDCKDSSGMVIGHDYWWYKEDGSIDAVGDDWPLIRNVVEQPLDIDFPTITITGLPMPQGFIEVMKHTIIGDRIKGLIITDPHTITVQTGDAEYVVSITTTN